MKKRCNFLVKAVLAIAVVWGVWALLPGKSITVSAFSSIDIYQSIADMTEQADLVVVGSYQKYRGKWNMDRDGMNPQQESATTYSEGRKYSFLPEQVLKGPQPEGEIIINKPYSTGASFPDGRGGQVPYQIPSQYFTEPKLGRKYLLFLNYDSQFDLFYSIGEPSEVLLANGVAQVQSNLFEPATEAEKQRKAKAQGGLIKYKITIDGSDIGSYAGQDFISGTKVDILLAQVAAAAQ